MRDHQAHCQKLAANASIGRVNIHRTGVTEWAIDNAYGTKYMTENSQKD